MLSIIKKKKIVYCKEKYTSLLCGTSRLLTCGFLRYDLQSTFGNQTRIIENYISLSV
jgi:hypothetical protein